MQKPEQIQGQMGGETSQSTLVYRTTKHVPTRETPFLLAYGIEVIIPFDICMLTFWVEGVVLNQNDTLLCLLLDHSEEKRQQSEIYITAYQQQIRAAHHKKVRPREFQVKDLVIVL